MCNCWASITFRCTPGIAYVSCPTILWLLCLALSLFHGGSTCLCVHSVRTRNEDISIPDIAKLPHHLLSLNHALACSVIRFPFGLKLPLGLLIISSWSGSILLCVGLFDPLATLSSRLSDSIL